MFIRIVMSIFAFVSVRAYSLEVVIPEYAGCQELSDFEIFDGDELTIEFQGSGYTPECVIVAPGTKVTIMASSRHPLNALESFNEFLSPYYLKGDDFYEPQLRTLDTSGFYSYFCTRHGDAETGKGMGGLVWVREQQN